MKLLKKYAPVALLIGYNLIPLGWVLFRDDSSYDLAYFYVLEAGVISICAFLLMLTKGTDRLWAFPALLLYLGSFAAVFYIFLYILGNAETIQAINDSGDHDWSRLTSFHKPMEVFQSVYRPYSEWIVLLMLGGPGYAFARRHLKNGFWNVDVMAVLGHSCQRMLMLFFAHGLSIGLVMWLESPKALALAITIVKTAYDLWEASPKFDPLNVFGIKRIYYPS